MLLLTHIHILTLISIILIVSVRTKKVEKEKNRKNKQATRKCAVCTEEFASLARLLLTHPRTFVVGNQRVWQTSSLYTLYILLFSSSFRLWNLSNKMVRKKLHCFRKEDEIVRRIWVFSWIIFSCTLCTGAGISVLTAWICYFRSITLCVDARYAVVSSFLFPMFLKGF